MVFSSLLFIYIFLPLHLICYAAFSDIRKKNICLLGFSLIFYAWGSPRYLVLLILMVLINYAGARMIDRNRGTRRAVLFLAADLAMSLGILAYFKYLGFFASMFSAFAEVFKNIPAVVLPIGISFYTFQLISYVSDVFRGEIQAEKKVVNVLLYASLFHQCIAGPIVRYKDIARDLKERKTSISGMNDGISRFCTGLAKKVLLANAVAGVLNTVLPETPGGVAHATVLAAWTGGLLYMLEIYLDFSAYSDMAIGLGKMAGFHYKENFNYPYTARSVTDFWHRWHISLSTFFRDYVYIPLGGSRKGMLRQLLNMLVVWALTGLWHGAAGNFVLWGLYYFVFLAAEKVFLLRFFEKLPEKTAAVFGRVYTFLVVYFGWILFRFTDMKTGLSAVRSMFGLNGNPFTSLETNTLLVNNILLIAVCLAAATPVAAKLAQGLKRKACEERIFYLRLYNILNVAVPLILLLISTITLVGSSYNPFIYFRF